jgi:hypothetical protein
MRNVKLQHNLGHNKRGCVIFLVTKVASSKVPKRDDNIAARFGFGDFFLFTRELEEL